MIDNTPWLLEYRPGEWYSLTLGRNPNAAATPSRPPSEAALWEAGMLGFPIIHYDPHNEQDPLLHRLVERAKQV